MIWVLAGILILLAAEGVFIMSDKLPFRKKVDKDGK